MKIRVQITDPSHPHFPEHGELTGELIRLMVGGDRMALMTLDACQHGTTACYVTPGQVREELHIPRPGKSRRGRSC